VPINCTLLPVKSIMKIPFYQPYIPNGSANAIEKALASRWLTSGPLTEAMSAELTQLTGIPYAQIVNSCTAALHLALICAGVNTGDEVIISANTFCSTANIIEHIGARLIPVDINPGDFNINPEKVKDAITPRTKAVIAVHFAGNPCASRQIADICRRQGITYIEDAAHALGAYQNGHHVGGYADMVTFSFYATKNITTGEGGALLFHDPSLKNKIERLTLHGMSKTAWTRYSGNGQVFYDIFEPGYKYNLPDLNAALGLEQIKRLKKIQKRRYEIIAYYDKKLTKLPGITPLKHQCQKNAYSGAHLYIISIDPAAIPLSRDELIVALQKKGVSVSFHFIPIYRFNYYQETYHFPLSDYPICERYFHTALSLPLYYDLKKKQLKYITKQIKHIITS
jgi:dTDP-4-amino-4,6-dideoxygalactose transaminase